MAYRSKYSGQTIDSGIAAGLVFNDSFSKLDDKIHYKKTTTDGDYFTDRLQGKAVFYGEQDPFELKDDDRKKVPSDLSITAEHGMLYFQIVSENL